MNDLTMACCRRFGKAITLSVLFAILLACRGELPHNERNIGGETMGTTWSIKLYSPIGDEQFKKLADESINMLADLDQKLSTYKQDSEITRFNLSSDLNWQTVSEEFAALVGQSLRISELSQGAFDITVSPLVDLWGFSKDNKDSIAFPSASEIARVKATTGYRHLQAREQPPALKKALPELQLDLSAIAKGYAADRLAALLEANGIANYLAEVGGELRASGISKELRPWLVGVEKPVPGWREIMRAVEVRGSGVATSGDYRNFIEIDGTRYSHTIDPRSGMPTVYKGASVTVIAESSQAADAWATAFFILPKEEALRLSEQHQLAVYYVEQATDGFVQTMNSLFADYLVQE
ncbi:MAG: FAD:protein FMN transferase [Gammaproteobacteria bacterium]|nr:FAD:protein FMN transferase [Gammaproteobacteria bacterium]